MSLALKVLKLMVTPDPPRLPADYARCMDRRCEVRHRCLRATTMLSDGSRAVTMAATLRKGWEPHDELCDAAITLEDWTSNG